jgi:hypothetical protein
MQPRKSKITLALAVIATTGFNASIEAAQEALVVGFTTVPNITLTESQAMDFGIGMSLADNVACTMLVAGDTVNTGNEFPGDIIMKMASTVSAGTQTGDLSGPGCLASVGSKGTVGIYEISGIEGGTVKVTVNDITAGTSFNYAAVGCVASYDGSGDSDTCSAIAGGSVTSAVVAASGDTVGNSSGTGIPVPGKTLIALGGIITTAKTHTASEVMTESFSIDVTY